jgi:M6 family metalloprotease-like protein
MTIKRTWLALALASCALDAEPELDEVEQALGPTVTLRTHFNSSTGDHYLTAVTSPAGYTQLRFEGRIFSPTAPQPPDTLPLYTWYGAARQDYLTSSDEYWWECPNPGVTIKNNYRCIRLEGYVHERPVAGTLLLQQWWSGSRADNRTTADPTITIDINATLDPDYEHVDNLGYVLPPTSDQPPALRTDFGWGNLEATGTRKLIVFRQKSLNVSSAHTNAAMDDLVFGPSFPNAKDYFNEVSQGRFGWERAALLGEYTYPNDLETWGNEHDYDMAFQDGLTTRMVFASLRAQSGDDVAALAQDHVAAVDVGWNDFFVTFQLHDVNGGDLMDNDLVAFKSCDGRWLRESNGSVTADATSSSAARFRIRGPTTVPIIHNTQVLLQSEASGRYLYEDTDHRIRANTMAMASSVFRIRKAIPDNERQARAMITAAALAGHDFRVYDTDGSGVIESDELTILVTIATRTNRGGSNRGFRTFYIPNTSPPLFMGPRGIASVGDRMSFMTLAHELMHTLGVGELYGNGQLSTMSETIYGDIDERETWWLDPWLRMRFGWVEPDIQAFNAVGASGAQRNPDSSSVRPLLVYDPREYDVESGTGEYFLVEFRTNQLAGYDTDAMDFGTGSNPDPARHGMVVWNVADRGAKTFATSGGSVSFGSDRPWTSLDGTIIPQYSDGTSSEFRLRVGETTTTSTQAHVEWTANGQLRPRIDGGTTVIRAGQIAFVDGMFAVDARESSGARFVDDDGNSTPASFAPISTTTPWTTSRVYVTVPSTLGPGNYRLYVWKNVTSRESNGHPIEIVFP